MDQNNSGEQIFNKAFFLEQIGGDKGLYEAIMVEFVKDLPSKTDELKNAVHSKDYANTTHYSHSIKGMCGIIGANVLRSVSEKIETLSKNNGNFDEMEPLILDLEKAKDEFLEYIAKAE
jgi:HPt (histidine-containing phosphotransfer) domain-containing protein